MHHGCQIDKDKKTTLEIVRNDDSEVRSVSQHCLYKSLKRVQFRVNGIRTKLYSLLFFLSTQIILI